MLGGVTWHILPHLPGVAHLHVNRPLVVQNSVVVVQNNGKGKTKKRAHVQICFLLIRSSSLEAFVIVVPI